MPVLSVPRAEARTSAKSQLSMMRHRTGFNKLGKPADQRKALLRALTTEVIRHGRIKTTLIRAKTVRKHVDHMIELGKPAARRWGGSTTSSWSTPCSRAPRTGTGSRRADTRGCCGRSPGKATTPRWPLLN
jgi:Ribosomal protein L17